MAIKRFLEVATFFAMPTKLQEHSIRIREMKTMVHSLLNVLLILTEENTVRMNISLCC